MEKPCSRCGENLCLPRRGYCRDCYNAYMREYAKRAALNRKHKPHSPAGRPHRCAKCKIKIRAARGLCDECANKRPLCQTGDRMGADRFFQTRR